MKYVYIYIYEYMHIFHSCCAVVICIGIYIYVSIYIQTYVRIVRDNLCVQFCGEKKLTRTHSHNFVHTYTSMTEMLDQHWADVVVPPGSLLVTIGQVNSYFNLQKTDLVIYSYENCLHDVLFGSIDVLVQLIFP